MNINDPRHPWSRLTAAARQLPDNRDTSSPYGFATRVTALGFSQELKTVSLAERFAWRALGAAALVAICSLAVNYDDLISSNPASAPAPDRVAVEDGIFPTTDAVAVMLDIAD
jgi:hypothetical protein